MIQFYSAAIRITLSLLLLLVCNVSALSSSDASYILFLNVYLSPDAQAKAATGIDIQQHRFPLLWLDGRRNKQNFFNHSCVHLHFSSLTTTTWQDFVLVRVIKLRPCSGHRLSLQERLHNVSVILPHIGRISVIRVAKDAVLSKHRVLASLQQPPPRQKRDISSSGRRQGWYPRRYFRLPLTTRWTGKGVRIALLDSGLDPLCCAASTYTPQQRDSGKGSEERKEGSNRVEASPLCLCTSFVPNVSCADSHNHHGTFSVSVMAGNISFAHRQATRRAPTAWGSGVSSSTTPERDGLPSPQLHYYGVAPGADIHMMRVFDNTYVSRTSWCVAALKAALQWGADIVTLSFGGHDYSDVAFTDTITELATHGVVVVAAAGNSGPGLGSVQNPADQNAVLAVGALGTRATRSGIPTEAIRWVSTFSGRGSSVWELPFGAGRIRPDLVALGEHVLGVGRGIDKKHSSNHTGSDSDHSVLELRVAHGTSVAAPLVAGVAALCIEAIRHVVRTPHINGALIKRLLMETAIELQPNASVMHLLFNALGREGKKKFYTGPWGSRLSKHSEGAAMTTTLIHYRNILQYSRNSQGAGEVCPMCALAWIENQHEQNEALSLPLLDSFAFPKEIDATSKHHLHSDDKASSPLNDFCLINWPYCEQPLFPSATPVVFNVSVYSPQCPTAKLNISTPIVVFTGGTGVCKVHRSRHCEVGGIEADVAKQLLRVRTEASPILVAYSGWLSLFAFSPPNASYVRLKTSSNVHANERKTEKVLGHYDLIVVEGYVMVQFTCKTTLHEHHKNINDYKKKRVNEFVCNITVPFRIPVVPRPSRTQRMVLDVTHQWFYPPDSVFSDDMGLYTHTQRRRRSHTMFEYDTDHPYTNMALLLLYMRRVMKFFVEVPLFHHLPLSPERSDSVMGLQQRRRALERYYRGVGMLLLLDPELPLLEPERSIISHAVLHHQLHIMIVSDWYSPLVVRDYILRNSTQDDLCATMSFPVNESTDVTNRGNSNTSNSIANNEARQLINTACLLKGACHVTSLNLLLRDISQGFLQLSTKRVVDGELILSASSDRGVSLRRHLGPMNTAGVLQWPLEKRRRYINRTFHGHENEGDGRATVMCGMSREWAKQLYVLTTTWNGKNTGGEMRQGDAAIIERVVPDSFVPIFGFVGVRYNRHHNTTTTTTTSSSNNNNNNNNSNNNNEGEFLKRGRVLVFTDSDGFSESAYLLRRLRVLDLLVYDTSTQLHDKSKTETVEMEASHTLAGLIEEETERPSFFFGLIPDFVDFLYTGDIPNFTRDSVCHHGDDIFTNDAARVQTSFVPNATAIPSAPTDVPEGHDGTDDDGKEVDYNEKVFELLLFNFFAASPHRLAVARQVREAIREWEPYMLQDDDYEKEGDTFFFLNERRTQTIEKSMEIGFSLLAKSTLLLLLLFFMLLSLLVVVIGFFAPCLVEQGDSCRFVSVVHEEEGEGGKKRR